MLSLLVAGCVYDPDKRCSPGEELDPGEACVCKANHVPISRKFNALIPHSENPLGRSGCMPCGSHEIAANASCLCESGYAFDADGKCVKVALAKVNFGDVCASEADCAGEGASCIDDDAIGMKLRTPYCSTRGCKAPSECPADQGYGCQAGDGSPFCRKPPTGEGDACDMSQGDQTNPACSEEASACAFGRCTSPELCASDNDCTPGLVCCDLTLYRPDALICTTSDVCPAS